MAGPASTTSLFSFFLCGAERIEPGSKRADVSIPRGKGSCNSVGQLGSAPFCWLQESDGRKEEEVVIRSIFRVMDCNKTFASSLPPPHPLRPILRDSSTQVYSSVTLSLSLPGYKTSAAFRYTPRGQQPEKDDTNPFDPNISKLIIFRFKSSIRLLVIANIFL